MARVALREFTAKAILQAFDDFGQSAERVGLVGSAIAEHDELMAIIEGFRERGVKVHTSSIRLDRISADSLKLLAESGLKTVTFAPETASEKLARKIGKWIPPEDMIAAAQKLSRLGFVEMKLYWIIGLPGESMADIEQNIAAIEGIVGAADIRVSCSVNPFIPKPHSRFSAEPMLSHTELSARFGRLKSALHGIPNLKLELNYSARSRLSAALSTCDREITHALIEMANGSGIRISLKKAGIDLNDEIIAPIDSGFERIR